MGAPYAHIPGEGVRKPTATVPLTRIAQARSDLSPAGRGNASAHRPHHDSTSSESALRLVGSLSPRKAAISALALSSRQILRRGQLWLIAPGVDHAKKAKRLDPRCAELVPCHGRHRHEILAPSTASLPLRPCNDLDRAE